MNVFFWSGVLLVLFPIFLLRTCQHQLDEILSFHIDDDKNFRNVVVRQRVLVGVRGGVRAYRVRLCVCPLQVRFFSFINKIKCCD